MFFKKQQYICVVLLCFLFFSKSVLASCEYTSEIQECIEANKEGRARSIENFVCIDSQVKENIIYQIVLDKSFKEVDKKVQEYLESLEKNKNAYFGTSAKQSFLDAMNEIENIFSLYGYFGKQYADLCKANNPKGILQKTFSCLGKEYSSPTESQYFFSDHTQCMKLALVKLSIARQTAYDVLKMNKHQVRNDIQMEFQQYQRESYNTLIELMQITLAYIERIWKKWPSKTRNAYY